MEYNNMDDESMRKELDGKFEELNVLIEESKKLSKKFREDIDKVKVIRDQKNSIVELVKKSKEERNKIQSSIKECSSVLKPLRKEIQDVGEVQSPFGLKRKIKEIEWKIWTEPMAYKKEEELVKLQKELEGELKHSEECLDKFKDEKNTRIVLMDAIREQKKFHESVVAESNRWDTMDKEEKILSKKISELKMVRQDTDVKILKLKDEISSIKKSLGMKETAEKAVIDSSIKSAIKSKVEEVRERFKKTGKLTTDDLIVLSASNEDIL